MLALLLVPAGFVAFVAFETIEDGLGVDRWEQSEFTYTRAVSGEYVEIIPLTCPSAPHRFETTETNGIVAISVEVQFPAAVSICGDRDRSNVLPVAFRLPLTEPDAVTVIRDSVTGRQAFQYSGCWVNLDGRFCTEQS